MHFIYYIYRTAVLVQSVARTPGRPPAHAGRTSTQYTRGSAQAQVSRTGLWLGAKGPHSHTTHTSQPSRVGSI